MNRNSGELHSSSSYGNHNVAEHSVPQAAPHEINNDEIETIVSAALPYGEVRPTDTSNMFFLGHNGISAEGQRQNQQPNASRETETQHSSSSRSEELLEGSPATTTPLIDEYFLAELRDTELGFVDVSRSSMDDVAAGVAGSAKKRKGKTPDSPFDEAAYKRTKSTPKDPTTVSKVVSWETWYSALLTYCEEFGTCNVPRTRSYTITDGRVMKLGEWVNTQRRQKILGTLAADRIEKLDALVAEGKFVWSLQWVPVTSPSLDRDRERDSSSSSSSSSAPRAEEMITVHQALWNQNYQSLLRYCEVHGHNNVPYHYSQASINGYPTPLHLGYWLHRQRRMRCTNKLFGERLQLLEALAADDRGDAKLKWDMGSAFQVNDGTWDQMCLALETYASSFGPNQQIPTGMGLTLPNPEGGSDLKVGSWLKKQRQRRQDGGMKPEREARLQALVDSGKIKWSAQNTMSRDRDTAATCQGGVAMTVLSEDKKWNKVYDLLKAYGTSQGGGEGCCNIHLKGSVMNSATGKTSTLGVWLMRQRRQRAKGWIQPLREAKLQELVDKNMLSWDLDLPKMKPGRKMGNRLPINNNGAYVVYVPEGLEEEGGGGQMQGLSVPRMSYPSTYGGDKNMQSQQQQQQQQQQQCMNTSGDDDDSGDDDAHTFKDNTDSTPFFTNTNIAIEVNSCDDNDNSNSGASSSSSSNNNTNNNNNNNDNSNCNDDTLLHLPLSSSQSLPLTTSIPVPLPLPLSTSHPIPEISSLTLPFNPAYDSLSYFASFDLPDTVQSSSLQSDTATQSQTSTIVTFSEAI